MLSNILNNREVRRYRRHIVARSPGVKGQRKGEPPKLCSYCRKPFRVGESRIQKRYKVGEDEIVAYFDKIKCQERYKPKLANGDPGPIANNRQKNKSLKIRKPKIPRKLFEGIPRFMKTFMETLYGLTDSQIAMLFLYAHTEGGTNSPYSQDRLEKLLGEMKLVAGSVMETNLISRIKDGLEDSDEESKDSDEPKFGDWYKDFRCASIGHRMKLAESDIRIASKSVRSLDFGRVIGFFTNWILATCREELKTAHKRVFIGDKYPQHRRLMF